MEAYSNYILVGAAAVCLVCSCMTGNIGPAFVAIVCLAAIYIYKNYGDKDKLFILNSPSPAQVASATGDEGVCDNTMARKGRNNMPGLPPPRENTILTVTPTDQASEPSGNFIRKRQLGLM